MTHTFFDQSIKWTFAHFKWFFYLDMHYFKNYFCLLEKLETGNQLERWKLTVTKVLLLCYLAYCFLLYSCQDGWSQQKNLLAANFFYLERLDKQNYLGIMCSFGLVELLYKTMYFDNRGVAFQLLRRILIYRSVDAKYFFSPRYVYAYPVFSIRKNFSIASIICAISLFLLNLTRLCFISMCK